MLAWDDVVDVLLGRIAREGASEPTVMPDRRSPTRTGSPAPGMDVRGRAGRRPDGELRRADRRHAVERLGPGQVAGMAAALQDADLERFARVFVGLPQLAVVTFTLAGSSLTVHQELRCPVGSIGAGASRPRTVTC